MDRQQPVTGNAYTIKETMEIASRIGAYKGRQRLDKIFMSGVLAGILLSFAGGVYLTFLTAPWFQDNAPGLIKGFASLFFPLGLVMCILSGSDLTTSSHLFPTIATLHRRLSPLLMLQHWVLTFFGNICGALFVTCVLIGVGGDFDTAVYKTEVQKFTTTKVLTPTWGQILVRGIGCNLLIGIACLLATMSRDVAGKIIGLWFPTFAFVALSFDHVVANMFFVPIGIWHQTPGVSVGYYIWKSMIPSLIGNIIGGGFFVGVFMWYLYLLGEGPVAVDGVFYQEQDSKHHGATNGSSDDSLPHAQHSEYKKPTATV